MKLSSASVIIRDDFAKILAHGIANGDDTRRVLFSRFLNQYLHPGIVPRFLENILLIT